MWIDLQRNDIPITNSANRITKPSLSIGLMKEYYNSKESINIYIYSGESQEIISIYDENGDRTRT